MSRECGVDGGAFLANPAQYVHIGRSAAADRNHTGVGACPVEFPPPIHSTAAEQGVEIEKVQRSSGRVDRDPEIRPMPVAPGASVSQGHQTLVLRRTVTIRHSRIKYREGQFRLGAAFHSFGMAGGVDTQLCSHMVGQQAIGNPFLCLVRQQRLDARAQRGQPAAGQETDPILDPLVGIGATSRLALYVVRTLWQLPRLRRLQRTRGRPRQLRLLGPGQGAASIPRAAPPPAYGAAAGSSLGARTASNPSPRSCCRNCSARRSNTPRSERPVGRLTIRPTNSLLQSHDPRRQTEHAHIRRSRTTQSVMNLYRWPLELYGATRLITHPLTQRTDSPLERVSICPWSAEDTFASGTNNCSGMPNSTPRIATRRENHSCLELYPSEPALALFTIPDHIVRLRKISESRLVRPLKCSAIRFHESQDHKRHPVERVRVGLRTNSKLRERATTQALANKK